MANITGAQNERVFQLKKWLGLNESPSGDTKLKFGEAAVMRNWKVTRDGNLQKRPGTSEVLSLAANRDKPVRGVWTGLIGGDEKVIAAVDTTLYSCYSAGTWAATSIGTILNTGNNNTSPCMFGFDDKLYIICDGKYYSYNGTTLTEIDKTNAYVPLVSVAVPPAGGGTTLEQVNKLTGKRRIWFSPDGSATTFQLPEKGLVSIDYAKKTADGSALTISSSSTANGTVTFSTAPAAGTSTVEIGYTAVSVNTSPVGSYKFAETYNGAQDTRVFLYGDGSYTSIYSGINYNGQPDATYFPDLNVMNVGISNTPITSLIRHGSLLLCFKPDSTYSIQYGQVTLEDGSLTAAFYVTPVNRSIGNEAPGQVQLVLNSPVTIQGTDIYQWVGNKYGNLTTDERQVRRISDRVAPSLAPLDLKDCVCIDDNYAQEFYVSDPTAGVTIVWNYALDVWYKYTSFSLTCPFCLNGKLYYCNPTGSIMLVDEACYSDDVYTENPDYDALDPDSEPWLVIHNPIDCYWESGSESFGADYQRKYSAMLWVGVKPDNGAELHVSVETDRNSSFDEKIVSTGLFDFADVDFSDFGFAAIGRPNITRLKIKAKKFVYYKLIMTNVTPDRTATVTASDVRVRFTGYAK